MPVEKSPPLGLRLAVALAVVGFAFPGLYLLWRNVADGAAPLGLLDDRVTLDPLLRTLVLAVTVSLAAAVIGTALAWLTIRTDLPAARLWRVLLPIPLVFPTFIGAAAFIRSLNPGGLVQRVLDTGFELRGFFGAWLVLTLFTYPYVYLPVAARLRRLPGSLEESARVLGDSPLRAFRRVVLPQLATSIAAGTLLVFLYAISDFGAVQLMRYDTLTRAIEGRYLASPAAAFAMALLLLVLAAIVVGAEQAVSRRLPTDGDLRSRPASAVLLGRGRWVALAGVAIVIALAVVAPVVALIDWAFGADRDLVVGPDKVVEASINTVWISIAAAVVAVAAVVPIALLAGRFKDWVGRFGHAVVIASFALPGILIALALRFWTLRGGAFGDLLADTHVLLIFAYVVRFGSLAIGVTLVAVRAVPDRFHDVAATLGAARRRRLRTIDLPLMAPGLLAAGGLVLLSTMKELPISLLLAPIGFPTLATRIFGSFEEAFVAEAGLMALVLVALSGVLTWLLVLRQADHL